MLPRPSQSRQRVPARQSLQGQAARGLTITLAASTADGLIAASWRAERWPRRRGAALQPPTAAVRCAAHHRLVHSSARGRCPWLQRAAFERPGPAAFRLPGSFGKQPLQGKFHMNSRTLFATGLAALAILSTTGCAVFRDQQTVGSFIVSIR